jgi:hypothetical protein
MSWDLGGDALSPGFDKVSDREIPLGLKPIRNDKSLRAVAIKDSIKHTL